MDEVTIPAELSGPTPWVLSGSGVLRLTVFEIYRVSLYVVRTNVPGRDSPMMPCALVFQYLRRVRADELIAATVAEMERVSGDPVPVQWRAELRALVPDVVRGDRLTALVDADGSKLTLYLNGRLLGHLDHPACAAHFVAVWTASSARFPELRAALCAGL